MPAVHANIAEITCYAIKKVARDAKEKGLRRVKKIRKNGKNDKSKKLGARKHVYI